MLIPSPITAPYSLAGGAICSALQLTFFLEVVREEVVSLPFLLEDVVVEVGSKVGNGSSWVWHDH